MTEQLLEQMDANKDGVVDRQEVTIHIRISYKGSKLRQTYTHTDPYIHTHVMSHRYQTYTGTYIFLSSCLLPLTA